MPSLDAVKMDSLFTMMKGEPGTRKSTAALSYPLPHYWASFDQKMEAMMLPAKKFGINTTDIDYDDYQGYDKFKAKLESLQINCKYKTIIVDSITSNGDAMNRETIKFKTSSNQQNTQTSSGDNKSKGKKIGSIYVPGMEEYNAEASAFQEEIALLKDIHKYHNCHVILIAHVVGQRKGDDGNKLTHHSRVIVTGGDKISAKIAAYMTEVYHFNIQSNMDADAEGSYGLYTSHTGNDYARTSLPLERRIVFNDRPLYSTFIKPAIETFNKTV